MKKLLAISGCFLTFIFTSIASAATDPCDSLTGIWKGSVINLKNNTACTAFYELYKSYDNVYFSLEILMPGTCPLTNLSFNAVCKEGKLTAGNLKGTAYEGMLDMRSEDYAINLYHH